MNELMQIKISINEMVKEQIRLHKERQESNKANEEESTDFIQLYLNEMQSKQNCAEMTTFSEEELVEVLNDLFQAGLDTVTTSLKWIVATLAQNEALQQRLYEDIQKVIGSDPVSYFKHR